MIPTRQPVRVPVPAAPACRPAGRPPSVGRSRRAVVAFLGFVLLTHGGFLLLLDYGPPRLRDPEYGRRADRALALQAARPDRPLVLAIGSSRTAMGIRPGVLEPADGPQLVNFALAGSGPVMELMAYRRARHDGVRPAAVLVEYWPAFLREDGPYHEAARIDVARLRPVDRQLVREYFPDPAKTEAAMRDQRLDPVFGHRMAVMNQSAGGWLPPGQRNDAMWDRIDPWGWLPGRESVTAEDRPKAMAAAAGYYVPLFAHYEVSGVADRAMRQLIAECRADGLPVALVYLPEATGFRAFMPEAAKRLAADHLARLVADLNLPLIDARDWMPDDDLPDGFHLTQAGAAAFTKKLAPAMAATFPGLGGPAGLTPSAR